MSLSFSAQVLFWRGPAPWFFLALPAREAEMIAGVRDRVTYGWGMVPAVATVGASRRSTALFPKDGTFLVPLKADLRRAEGLAEGDWVDCRLEIEVA